MNYYQNTATTQSAFSIQQVMTSTMKKVYLKMTFALAVSGFTAFFAAGSLSFIQFIINNSWFMWVLLLGEIGLVVGISAGINKLSSPAASALFFLFAVVNGLALTPIFWAYTGATLAKTFFITAGTFAAMSIYGFTTRQDLSKMGNILVMALIGLIIASVVNMFMRSSGLDWIISIAGVLIFVGLTAWDTQKIKTMAAMMPASETGRLATIGALSLYLDFVNLFLYLLRIFGNRD